MNHPRQYEVDIACGHCGRPIAPIITHSPTARIYLRVMKCTTCNGPLMATGEVRARTVNLLPFDLEAMRSATHLGRPTNAEIAKRRADAEANLLADFFLRNAS